MAILMIYNFTMAFLTIFKITMAFSTMAFFTMACNTMAFFAIAFFTMAFFTMAFSEYNRYNNTLFTYMRKLLTDKILLKCSIFFQVFALKLKKLNFYQKGAAMN